MSVTRRHDRCPECGSRDFKELLRYEAGGFPGVDEDMAVYSCQLCLAEWDNVHDAGRQFQEAET